LHLLHGEAVLLEVGRPRLAAAAGGAAIDGDLERRRLRQRGGDGRGAGRGRRTAGGEGQPGHGGRGGEDEGKPGETGHRSAPEGGAAVPRNLPRTGAGGRGGPLTAHRLPLTAPQPWPPPRTGAPGTGSSA